MLCMRLTIRDGIGGNTAKYPFAADSVARTAHACQGTFTF
jgi:hypothetical protein